MFRGLKIAFRNFDFFSRSTHIVYFFNFLFFLHNFIYKFVEKMEYTKVHDSASDDECITVHDSASESESESDVSDYDSIVAFLMPFVLKYTNSDETVIRRIQAKYITTLLRHLNSNPTMKVVYFKANFSKQTNDTVKAITNLFKTFNFAHLHSLTVEFLHIDDSMYNSFMETVLDPSYLPSLTKLTMTSYPGRNQPYTDIPLLARNTSIRSLHVGDVSRQYFEQLITNLYASNFNILLFSYDLFNPYNIDDDTFQRDSAFTESAFSLTERNYNRYLTHFLQPGFQFTQIINSGLHANYTRLLRQIIVAFLLFTNNSHMKPALSSYLLYDILTFIPLNSFIFNIPDKKLRLNDY